MRESNYVEVARLNGMGDLEIIFRELMPNLFPFLAASFVGAMASGILAAVGLEALGLGPQHEPTLGMTIYWSLYYGAVISNWWWWYGPPILLVAWIFISLYLIAAGSRQVGQPTIEAEPVMSEAGPFDTRFARLLQHPRRHGARGRRRGPRYRRRRKTRASR